MGLYRDSGCGAVKMVGKKGVVIYSGCGTIGLVGVALFVWLYGYLI